MATQEEKIAKIQRILKSEYGNTRWKGFLSELFSSSNFFTNPSILPGINASIASQALHIGSISINENGIARNIAVYEVMLADNVVLERNRVGLRNLLKTHWKEQDAAFIVYYHPHNKSWRFSYVSELKTFNEAGEYVDNKTEPKRYTYVLGETESCRTAAIQFSKLQDKAGNATLDDVKEAFSVEKMSKEFFDTYKEHYLDFVQFLTGKRLEKVSGKWEEVVKHAPNTQLITIFNNNEKDVRDFCKKLLGRIVFLYFIQKKGWLGVPVTDDWGKGNYNYLSELFKNCRNPAIFYSEYLSKLFFDTLNQQRPNDVIEIISGEPCRIPYLNGGLFEEDDQNHRNLVLEANLFKQLFEFFDQYNFTIYEDDPNDHTVAVDPEMLGHIFENLLEDNKDKGAFYTPKEIVHYMCQESLIEYLTTWFEGKNYQVQQDTFISLDNAQQTSFVSANEGRTGQGVLEIAQPAQSNSKVINRSLIEKLLKKQLSDEDKQAVIEHAAEFNEALDKVKICDPAIGSGAFPMGLLLEIFTAKQTIHTFTHGDLTSFEPAKVKLNIIQNSIYGVDIERGAVDIARLRFWLSLVVDEPEPQPLPNLDYKIVVGNSLISKLGDDVIEIDWDVKKQVTFDMFGAEEAGKIKQTLTELNNLQKAFFNPKSDKKALAPKIRNLKIDLLIQQLNLMIETRGLKVAPRKMATQSQKDFVAQTELYIQTQGWLAQISQLQALKSQPDKTLDFFDWQLNFAEVLNNEVTEKVGFDIVIGNPPYVQIKWLSEDYSQSKFETFTKSSDIYCLFYERATSLLKENGIATFITSNKWLRSDYGNLLKKYLLENSKNIRIIDFGGFQIFETAAVDTNIMLWFRGKVVSKHINYTSCSKITELNERLAFKSEVRKHDEIWVLTTSESQRVKDKIESSFSKLAKFDIEFNYGVLTGANKAYIISEEQKNFLSIDNDEIRNLIVPILRGKDLEKYWYNFSSHYLINVHNGVKSINLPPIKLNTTKHQKLIAHFESFGSEFKTRGEQGSNWYNLRSCNFINLYSKPKILYADIVQDSGKFYFDEKGFYANDTAFMIYSDNIPLLKFLTAILNSKAAGYFYSKYYCGGSLGHNGLRYKKEFLQKLPVPDLNTKIIEQHERVLDLKSKGIDTANLERLIDNLVFKLYRLDYSEVKIIDPDFSLSESEYNAIAI